MKLISDGDVSGALMVTDDKYNVDIFLGIGGGPEGVLAAAALDAYDCSFQGRFLFDNDEDKTRAKKMGIKDLSKKYECLCFDEFYVEDIADAMLLGKFMTELFESDLSFFATSNIAPVNLYEGGLQRKLFMPAIKAIEAACEIYHLNSDVDFRLRALEKSGSYFYPSDKNIEIIENIFNEITQNKKAKESFININNRKIDILAFSKGVLWVNFLQICSSPRSAADYIEISKEFHTVILSDVPIINSDDEARRFISFIDECYDRKVKLIISAAELPEKIYVKSRLEEKFKRTVSRLTEMQSKDYLSQAHLA